LARAYDAAHNGLLEQVQVQIARAAPLMAGAMPTPIASGQDN
jgi:hypothetical protein